MAKYTLLFILLLIKANLSAQELDSTKAQRYKFYVGIGLTNIQYHIWYDNPTNYQVGYGSFSPIDFHVGYRINERASVQVGIAYGGIKQHSKNIGMLNNGSGQLTEFDLQIRTRAFALPVTGRFIMVNLYRKMPIYAVVTLMPAYGITNHHETGTTNNETTILSKGQDRKMEVFATAGFGFNYRVKKRLNGNVELLLFKRNLTGMNSKFYDWRGEDPWLTQLISSLSLGFNYNLKRAQ